MRKTPRTDAYLDLPFENRQINWWDFARQLEDELAAAREDTKRLDWLENNRSSGVGANRTKRLVGLSPDGTSVQEWKEWAGNTVREAIDAALAAPRARLEAPNLPDENT